ncbi:Shedu anti-phage system protein SduA domain-containing protein [Neptuniibacter sp. QD29_5]|uniref:Shedu anti-phage system protein SduA domain-containing protein n=1 Tax=Neptuniibacter sp. QD29_5 TaxID=3398207 RepID=UPI0039F62081
MTKLDQFLEILEKSNREQEVQDYLEENPHYITGTKYVAKNILIRKFKFGADYISDFAFIEPTSGGVFLHFVEIENPQLEIFKRSEDHFSEDLNKAMQQTRDWAVWCSENRDNLETMLKPILLREGISGHPLTPRFHLIAGRRDQIESNELRRERWKSIKDQFSNNGIFSLKTYDGFINSIQHFFDNNIENNGPDPIRCTKYSRRQYIDIHSKEVVV